MLKIITGYISIDSKETMIQVSERLNDSGCTIEAEEEDYIQVTDIDMTPFTYLMASGAISESDFIEVESCDAINFFIK